MKKRVYLSRILFLIIIFLIVITIQIKYVQSTSAPSCNGYCDIDINLKSGINLISFPFMTPNKSIEYIFNGTIQNLSRVYYYDSVEGWKIYNPYSKATSNLFEISPLKAYFVLMKYPTAIKVDGYTTYDDNSFPHICLSDGWNLIGKQNLSQDTILNQLAGQNYSEIWKFNSTNNSYFRVGDSNISYPGEGYWVYATSIQTDSSLKNINYYFTSDSLIVNWSTDNSETSVVRYGIEPCKYDYTEIGVNGTTHSVKIFYLRSNWTYYFTINSVNNSGKTHQSKMFTIRTPIFHSLVHDYYNAPFPHISIPLGVHGSGWPLTKNESQISTCVKNNSVTCISDMDCLKLPGYICSDNSWISSCACNNTPNIENSGRNPINYNEIGYLSNFSMVQTYISPTSDSRPDLMYTLRKKDPNNLIFPYVTPRAYCPSQLEYDWDIPINGIPSYKIETYRAMMNFNNPSNQDITACITTNISGNGWLFNTNGAPFCNFLNLAHRTWVNGAWKYDVSESFAEFIFNYVYLSNQYDGISIDEYCTNIDWEQNGYCEGNLDYARAGYTSKEEFDKAWKEGHKRLGQHLRELITNTGDTKFPIIANCIGEPLLKEELNGWWREHFPNQDGGTWFSNMFGINGGYLIQDYTYRYPQLNAMISDTEQYYPYSSYSLRNMRFGLASASLGNGYFAFVGDDYRFWVADYEHWWYDEYAVDISTGRSSNSSYNGWLGQPKGSYYQYFIPTTNPELLIPEGFETSKPSWKFYTWPDINGIGNGTFVREFGNAAEGSYSAHFNITSTNSSESWRVQIDSNTTFNFIPNNEYSVTFFAKADHQRIIQVFIEGISGRIQQIVPINTSWKRYQVFIKPTGTSLPVPVIIYLGEDTGEIWIDDIHLQQGVSSVYRRDFDNGIVLVNPADSTLTIPLEKPYKKILGSVNPSLNNGSTVNNIVLGGAYSSGNLGDAIFLINIP